MFFAALAIISVHLHLSPAHLTRSALLDDIRDSVHYGYLTKSITTILDSPSVQFSDPRSLVDAITDAVS